MAEEPFTFVAGLLLGALAGFTVGVILCAIVSRALPAVATELQNEERWEVERDERGRRSNVIVHRNVQG